MRTLVFALTLMTAATPALADDNRTPALLVAQIDDVGDTAPVLVAQAEPDAGSGSAIVIPPPPADTTQPAPPVVDPQPSILQQLEDLKTAYQRAKDNTDKSARMLVWAAVLATALKLLLDVLGRIAGGKSWMPLVAMGLAVPIGLLSHFVAGHSWFDSILVAGAGPGAVFVHELIKRFTKKPAQPATT